MAPVSDTTATTISTESQSTSSTETLTEPSSALTLPSQETSSQEETSLSTDINTTLALSTAPTATTEAPASTTTGPARNKAVIGDYAFVGCLGSSDNYPFFEEVTSDSKMTPELCVSLAKGARYIGVNAEYVLRHYPVLHSADE